MIKKKKNTLIFSLRSTIQYRFISNNILSLIYAQIESLRYFPKRFKVFRQKGKIHSVTVKKYTIYYSINDEKKMSKRIWVPNKKDNSVIR